MPPFDKVETKNLGKAIESAIALHLAELDAIANDPAAPTFANTLAAMERSGRALDRVSTIYERLTREYYRRLAEEASR